MNNKLNNDDNHSHTAVLGTDRPDAPGSDGSGSSANDDSRPSFMTPRNKTLIGAALAVVLVLGVHHWIVSSHYESTDDAYLTSDVVQIAPQVSGVVKQVLVRDNQEVKAGQLMVVLDDATYRAALAQKEADLHAAIAQAKGAGVSVMLTSEQGDAQLMQAHGIMDQASSSIIGAQADLARQPVGCEECRC